MQVGIPFPIPRVSYFKQIPHQKSPKGDNKRVRGWESKEGDFTVIRGGFSNYFSKKIPDTAEKYPK